MSNWRVFKIDGAAFSSEEAKQAYLESTRCAICHQRLETGDYFDLRPISNYLGYTQQAVIIHKKCVDWQREEQEEEDDK